MDNGINNNRDITYFARTNFRSSTDKFGIKRKDRRQHMYILGKSGTGKSVLLSNLIVQNIQNGEGLCVVDPHGELVEEILHLIPDHRVKDVVYFNPADTDFHIGFNVLQLDDPKYKHLVASGLMGIFTKIWANAWSSRMEYILNNAILALLDTPGTTLLGIPRLLVDKDYRQMIIGNLKDPVVRAFWVHEYEQWRDQFRNEAIAPIQNKVGQFLSTSIIRNVVGQNKSTINIFDIMNEGKIFLVNVSKGRIGEDNSALLGGMLITKIQLAAMERVRIPEEERKDFYLYVDEFQNFATDSFANILSEARKYRLNLIVAHQYTAQLENKDGSKVRDAVFGNVGTMIIFRVGADDADFLEKEFEPEFTAQDLVNLPNYHVYLKLMIDGVTSRPFSAATLPPIKVDVSDGVKEKIIASSRELYTKPRQEVEDTITKWSGMVQNEEGESKFKAECSNCGKVTFVPFEPKEGRPVYCKECMFKIKSGEIKAGTGFVASRSARQDEGASHSPLAMLGIEFQPSEITKSSNPSTKTNTPPPNPSSFVPRKDFVKPVFKNNFPNKTQPFVAVKTPAPTAVPIPTASSVTPETLPVVKNQVVDKPEVKVIPKVFEKNIKNHTTSYEQKNTNFVKKHFIKNEDEQQKSMSLDSLKNKTNTIVNKNINTVNKEASEEKKSSLKDLLTKVMAEKEKSKEETKIPEIKKETTIASIIEKAKEEEKNENIFIPIVPATPVVPVEEKIEIKKIEIESIVDLAKEESETKKEEIKTIIQQTPRSSILQDEVMKVLEGFVGNKEYKEEMPVNNSQKDKEDLLWQKPKTQKEVPQEVLLKVLE